MHLEFEAIYNGKKEKICLEANCKSIDEANVIIDKWLSKNNQYKKTNRAILMCPKNILDSL